MAGNIKGITIEFRGETSSLEQALRKINSETRTIDSELKKVNNALKFNPTSVELWRQKQTLLNQKLKETNEKAALLRETLKKVDSGEIDMSAEDVRDLKRQLIEAESKAKTFSAQLKQIGNANLKALSEQLKQVGSKMTEVGKSMTTKVTAPIVAGYTIAAKYASDYEENLNKLDVAFGENSQAVKDWANNASKEFGLSKVQATDAASAFGALGKGIGLTEGEAANMSTTLAGLSADLGSYFNVGVDESSKALEGIFTGESEALKKFGVVMTDTNLQKFAEDQGLVWKEMDQTEKTMLRYQYVLDKTKDAQGDFSRTSDGTANSAKIFQASLQDLGTAIGTNLLPIITPVIQKITELVNKFNDLSPRTQKIITIVGLVVAAIGPLLVVLGTIISSVGAVIGVIGALSAPIMIAVGAIAAIIAIGVLLYKNWDTIKAKAQELWNKFKTVFAGIKSTVTTIWNAIKALIQRTIKTIVSTVVSKINAMRTTIQSVFNTIRSTITTIFTNISTKVSSIVNGLRTSVSNAFNTMRATITTIFTNIRAKLTSIVSGIRSSVSTAFNALKGTVKTVWDGIKNAIMTPIKTAYSKVSGIVKKLKNLFPLKAGKIFTGLKIPKINISKGKAPFGIGGKGTAPSISIDWYAKGGIFDSPTIAGIGEAGPEAVVPLDRFWDEIRNSNARTDALLARQNQILLAVLEEVGKEKNFKVDGIWAGRYVNSLVR